jgi:hypothetical protein
MVSWLSLLLCSNSADLVKYLAEPVGTTQRRPLEENRVRKTILTHTVSYSSSSNCCNATLKGCTYVIFPVMKAVIMVPREASITRSIQ